MPIPYDDCPKCETPMERGLTEFGQLCPGCLHYEDDPYWAMHGEWVDELGEPIPNPRAGELPIYLAAREFGFDPVALGC